MKFHRSFLAAVPAILLSCGALATAQESPEAASPEAAVAQEAQSRFLKAISGLDWKNEGQGDIGGMATIAIPTGFTFTGKAGTIKMMEFYGNLTSGQEGGYLAPQDHSWFAVFEFDEVGYVKDDEKDNLDADEILKQMQANQKEANKELARRGMETLEVVGWKTPPFYNPGTNNLEWAILLRSASGGETLNYKTKLLGRKGVMEVVLVCDEKQLDAVLPQFQDLLKGFAFNPGLTYGEYKKGDKIAQYGLTGLILGGGLLAAGQTSHPYLDEFARRLRNPRPGNEGDAAWVELVRPLFNAACTRAGAPMPEEVAPKPERGSAAWCPRCLAIYNNTTDTCRDCSGLPLRGFSRM